MTDPDLNEWRHATPKAAIVLLVCLAAALIAGTFLIAWGVDFVGDVR